MKVGGEYRRARLDVFYQINKRGSFVFDGTRGPWSADATLNGNLKSMADFLAGYPTNSSGAVIVQGELQRDYYQNSFDWWAHDTLRVTPKLSLEFRRALHLSRRAARRQQQRHHLRSRRWVSPDRATASIPCIRRTGTISRRASASPTLPRRNGKTVIRGAWGVFYDVPALNFFVANTGLPNGGAAGINANPGGPNPVYTITARNVVFQQGVPVFGNAGPVAPFGAFGVSQDFRTPYVQNFNLNIQRQLSSSTMLAGRLRGQPRAANSPCCATSTSRSAAFARYATQYPTLATIDTAFSMANSNYNSLQMQLRQSLWKGLTATFNYTLGHAIDNTSDVRNTVPTNSYDLKNERGNSTFDIRHIVTSFVSYQLPGSHGSRRCLTKGWQLNSLFTVHGGTPLNILAGTNRSGTGENRDRVDVVGDPFTGFSPAIPNSLAIQYINKAAFANPATGTLRQHRTERDLRSRLRLRGLLGLQEHADHGEGPRRIPRRDLQPVQPDQLQQSEHDVLLQQLRTDYVHSQRWIGAGPGLRRTAQHPAWPEAGVLGPCPVGQAVSVPPALSHRPYARYFAVRLCSGATGTTIETTG